MLEPRLLDRGYTEVLRRCVATGQAPHYTELAGSLGIPLETARSLIHDLVSVIPGWVHPGTNLLASFPPFNLQPTQYRVSVDGEQRWFAQCGFEALAIRWLFPGRSVVVEAPCLCCGEPMVVEMTDAGTPAIDPPEMIGYTSSEIGGDPATRPFR